jgi:hypothetical protein
MMINSANPAIPGDWPTYLPMLINVSAHSLRVDLRKADKYPKSTLFLPGAERYDIVQNEFENSRLIDARLSKIES